MIKVRNKNKIYQFSLDKKLINEFENSQKAQEMTNIHYDSILKCCKGKLKTVKGFIFSYNDILEEKKSDYKCAICNSNETVRSMAMHLKHFHNNLKTEDYVKIYGEFRPKNINNIKLKEKSNIICQICNEKLLHNRQLMFHININHNEITQEEYILKYMYNNVYPTCKCGCGGQVQILINGKNCDLDKNTYSRDYIKGHWDWNISSNEEQELYEYISQIYKDNIIRNDRTILDNKELDIYLPNLNLAIEYNGFFWHSEKMGKLKEYHLNKTLLAKSKNINLIHIFSDEWVNKKEIVKSRLLNKLNLTPNKIYARKCKIKEVLIKDKDEFLNNNHIQGKDKSSIKLGLYHDDKLVSIMTFGHPRTAIGKTKINIENQYELVRFSNLLNTNVIGGASRLLKHFIKTYNPQHIYSFSDNRWSNWENNMYLKLDFKFISKSEPSYWYSRDCLHRLHRYNFSKNNLRKMGYDITKTEKQIMEELNYFKIWDCGVSRFEWKNK